MSSRHVAQRAVAEQKPEAAEREVLAVRRRRPFDANAAPTRSRGRFQSAPLRSPPALRTAI